MFVNKKTEYQELIREYRTLHPDWSDDKIISVLDSELNDIQYDQESKKSIMEFEQEEFDGWSIEREEKSQDGSKMSTGTAIGLGVAALAVGACIADLALNKGRNIKKVSQFVKTKAKGFSDKAKIPYRFKSSMHDSFHGTGDMVSVREIELIKKQGLSIDEAVKKVWGNVEKSQMPEYRKYYAQYEEQVNNYVAKLDKSFEKVLPSPIRQKYYRGIFDRNCYGAKVIREANVGDIITPDLGYPFATLRKSVAKGYTREGGCLIEIVAPAGTKVSRELN